MSTTAFSRSKNVDRFYNPPARRQLLNKKQQQFDQIRKINQIHRRQKEVFAAETAEVVVVGAAEVRGKSPELNDCASTSTSISTITKRNSSNLDRFLEFTTPLISAQYFSKTSMKRWGGQEDDFRPYFVLGDLWESFKEWSAYGAGVPLLLNGSDSVVQYYVPSLSGIQLYIDSSKPSPKTRTPGEESDESFRETSSDGSSDYEIEGLNPFGVRISKEVVESNLQGVKNLSLQDKPLNGSSSDEGESSCSSGDLIFEYFEHAGPFSREPLADKIALLASHFPELKTYRSCDLSSSSWISVAWYPIYRIPTGPTLQNLESCFLTFHSLSTPVSGRQNEWQSHFGSSPTDFSNCFEMPVKLPLPIFGMACYKFKISMWDQTGVEESPKANSLLQSADDWLRHLNVNHPDYRFFTSHKYTRDESRK